MNILIVLTSHDTLGNTGRKTGFWLEEFAAPYYAFLDAGAKLTLASPLGGQPPLDPKSDDPDAQTDDTRRFKQIVRGRIRKNLRKYVTHGEMIGRKGRDLVSIPIPQLDIPHFRFGDNGAGGVGQGDGEEGQPLGKGGNPQSGSGKAGSDPGDGPGDCEVGSPVASVRPYDGPCRWGWVHSRYVTVIAG